MRVLVATALVLLSGCAGAADGPHEDLPAQDLPPPRSSNAANNIGAGTVADVTGQVPDSAWAEACVEQWASQAYVYQDAPIVDGKPCWFRPTPQGTLFWHVVNFTGDARHGVPAAPIARDDGFYDWAVFDQTDYLEAGGELALYENGSSQPLVSWGEVPADPRDGLSAVRIGQTVHVLLQGWSYAADVPNVGQVGGSGAIYHAWWSPGQEPRWESYPSGSVFNDHTWRTGGGGTYAIGAFPGGSLTNTVFRASEGAFEVLSPLPGALHDVIEHDGALHACITVGPTYQYATMPIASEAAAAWSFETITTGLLAQLAFTCDITATDAGIVVVIDSPAPIGDGPNPMAGSHAFTRRDPGAWDRAPIGFSFHSGDDLATYAGRPVHVGATGSGTSSGDPQCGMTVRTTFDAEWREIYCNHHGDWSYVLDADRPTIVASAMINPPFDTWKGAFEVDGVEMTSVVLVLPEAELKNEA